MERQRYVSIPNNNDVDDCCLKWVSFVLFVFVSELYKIITRYKLCVSLTMGKRIKKMKYQK